MTKKVETKLEVKKDEAPKAKKSGRPKGARNAGSDVKNNVRRPDPGTIGGAIWALCDEAIETKGRTLSWEELQAAVKDYGDGAITKSSLHLNYIMHKKYHGIRGIVKGD